MLTESDHNPIICEFSQLWSDSHIEENGRYEIFQFNDQDGAKKFNEMTSSSTLSNCIKDGNVKQSAKKWMKVFNNCLHRSFKKIRINNKKLKHDEVHDLMMAKTQIQKKIEDILKHVQENPSEVEIQSQIVVSLKGHVDRLDLKIADLCAAKNMRTIKDHYFVYFV